MKKQRKHYTPEEKVAILRKHLAEGVPISDLCDQLVPAERTDQPGTNRVSEKKIQTKDEVLADLMAEHVALKKRVGEL